MSQLIEEATAFDRLPPCAIDAERCTIASMMLDNEMIGVIIQILNRDAFYQADHQIIFDIITKLYEQNRAVDAVILCDELLKRQLLEEVGGVSYLSQILSSVPSAAHGAHYAGIVQEKYILRRVIETSNDNLRAAYAPQESAREVLENAQRRAMAIEYRRDDARQGTFSEACMEAYEGMEDRGIHGLETGFFELDAMLNGLHEGEMIVLAARPSIGKTALGMNIIDHIAVDSRVPCAIFCLEMTQRELAQRMLCSRASVDMQKARKGFLNAEEYARIAKAVKDCSDAPIYPVDTMNLTAMDFRVRCRRMVINHGVKLILLDYLQLMASPDAESRQQGVSEISRSIKCVARELKVPIIAVSQLNRQTETREGHRPRMSDLRESGSLEQDADVVLLLHREDYYRSQAENFVPDNVAEVIIAKQRSGPTGSIKLTFDNSTTTFRNHAAQRDIFP